MRKNRVVEQDRCYHLVSRLAHRAFFLDDGEKDRAVALMRRVEEFSGVVVLAYAFMSNHFHIFIYVPSAEEIGEGDILRRIRVLYRDASLSQVVATWNRLKDRGAGAFQTRASDEEVCFALRGLQVLVRPQDVELGGVHAAVCAKGGGRHQEPNPLFQVLTLLPRSRP